MRNTLNLFLVDNDFEVYDTHMAIGLVIRRLRGEHLNMYYSISSQKDALEAVVQVGCAAVDAVVIDNDFGEGITSLKKLLPYIAEHKLPVAYVSAYDMAGLLNQHQRLLDPHSPVHSPQSLAHPSRSLVQPTHSSDKTCSSHLVSQALEDELVSPYKFQELGITLIQKRGREVAKDHSLHKLADDIYAFVRPLYD
jgi:hypothetical protein